MNNNNEKLAPNEIERYARHLILPEIGGQGQQKLKQARVVVVGAGGLGAPVLSYLAAAGVGTLGIVDDDHVSLSNLQRQIIHDSQSVGQYKTDSAERSLKRINPHSVITKHTLRLDEHNIAALLACYDIVVDGSDNFATRYLVADHAAISKKPLVSGAMGRFDGSLSVFKPYEGNNPSYRDLFPTPPRPGTIANCAETGVIGALPGIIGALQAMEVIKLITEIGEPLIGRLMLYDSLGARFDVIRYHKTPLSGQ